MALKRHRNIKYRLGVHVILSLLAFATLACLALLAGKPGALPVSISGFEPLTTLLAASVLLVIVLLSVRMLWRKVGALSRVEDATRRLTSGDYSRRIEIETGDEFQTFTQAFNELTDQLQESLMTSQSLAHIDHLILSGVDLDTILRKVLISSKMDAVDVTLCLRNNIGSVRISTYRMNGPRMVEDMVMLPEMTDDSLQDIDGYRRMAGRISDGEILECLPVSGEGKITGIMVVTGSRSLKASESKRLTDLVDRLSVAITNIRRSENLYQQAHFDALTGLINRHAFEGRLREHLARTSRGEKGALMFIDLDGFKKVNDTEGHDAGDRLLVIISERLREVMRSEDIIARLGGDEFAIIVPDCGDNNAISKLCERIIGSVTMPLVVDRMEHSIGASIGIALYPDDGQKSEEIVMKADSAMYRAKESGGSQFAFFDDTLNEANRYRVVVESRLRSAIKQGDLEVYFQPKLNLKTWTVASAEALMRWSDKELGAVSPDVFVPIAEETNLIHDFTAVLVEKIADLFEASKKSGLDLRSVALNASPKQLMTEGFALTLLSRLDQRRLPHECIEVEVTESVFARDTLQVIQELEILRSAGVKIALDDFGTGYSSLNMLRELPLDILKIDRAFITELESSNEARILVRHVISMASALGLEVVAEGVESDVQLQHVVDTDCDYIQGYLISRAHSQVDFINVMLEWQGAARSKSSRVDLAVSQNIRRH